MHLNAPSLSSIGAWYLCCWIKCDCIIPNRIYKPLQTHARSMHFNFAYNWQHATTMPPRHYQSLSSPRQNPAWHHGLMRRVGRPEESTKSPPACAQPAMPGHAMPSDAPIPHPSRTMMTASQQALQLHVRNLGSMKLMKCDDIDAAKKMNEHERWGLGLRT